MEEWVRNGIIEPTMNPIIIDDEEEDSDWILMYSDSNSLRETPLLPSISPQYQRSGLLCSGAVTTAFALGVWYVAPRVPINVARLVAMFCVPFRVPLFRIRQLEMRIELWPRTWALWQRDLDRFRDELRRWENRGDIYCWDADERVLSELSRREANIRMIAHNIKTHKEHLVFLRGGACTHAADGSRLA